MKNNKYSAMDISEIYLVHEKNCYPSKNNECIHLCTVKIKNRIEDLLLNSGDILEINNRNNHKSSIHFEKCGNL
jgi:hypothetical protein